MSKKTEFHTRLSRGMDTDRAAELSGISNRKVKFKYRKEWEAVQASQAAEPDSPATPTLAPHLQEYWNRCGQHFQSCLEDLSVEERTQELQWCIDAEKPGSDWRNGRV